ncbi:MAG: DUF1800 domain-containing protein [Pseudomonadota bacterium]
MVWGHRILVKAAVFGVGFLVAGCNPAGDSQVAAILAPEGSPGAQTSNEAARFLVQASFGPTPGDIEFVKNLSYSGWIESQLAMPPTEYLSPLVLETFVGNDIPNENHRFVFWESAVVAPDQLRQRMVYALSQILVVSDRDQGLGGKPLVLAQYQDILTRHAFGNYRDLLDDVTYSPAMAQYLTYLRNRKADMDLGRVPDENYAREIMQLFTIGLVELDMDGTPSAGNVETYDNEDVKGLAKVFTGLSYQSDEFFHAEDEAEHLPLMSFNEEHSQEEKTFLGLTIPAGTDADTSISMALDHLFAHPNLAPFLSRQLIQRFVTSNPSPDYVRRVAETFERGVYQLPSGREIGESRRGDLAATLCAILLDPEARQDPLSAPNDFGKVREPVLRFAHWARAFRVASADATKERALRDTTGTANLNQQPFRSPSVFNFYRPGYVAPSSATGEAGLTAPELQIVSEASHVGYVNFMSRFIRDDTPEFEGATGDEFKPNYTEEVALAHDPRTLLDRLDTLLTYGLLTEEVRNRITGVLNEIPIREGEDEEDDRKTRVHLAILMVTTSPEYLTQR